MKGERLISKELSFTPYDVKWFPLSSRLCVVGATKKGTGQIAVYGLAGKHVELKVEVYKQYIYIYMYKIDLRPSFPFRQRQIQLFDVQLLQDRHDM